MRGRKVELELQSVSEGVTGTGVSSAWSGSRRIKGTLRTKSGNERFVFGKDTVYATHEFICSVAPALDPTEKDRFIKPDDGSVFDIVFINNVGDLDHQWQFDLLEVK